MGTGSPPPLRKLLWSAGAAPRHSALKAALGASTATSPGEYEHDVGILVDHIGYLRARDTKEECGKRA